MYEQLVNGCHFQINEYKIQYKESWTPKNLCLGTVVLEKTLESPLDCKEIQPVNPKGNQSWIFLGALMLKLQHFGRLMWRTDSFEKTLMLGKIEGTSIFEGESERNDRGWDGWMASPTWWTWVWVCSGSWWWTGKPGMCSPWDRKESDMTEQLHWLTEDELKILPLLAFSNNLNIFMHIKGSMSKLWKSRNALKKSLIPLHTHW